MDLSVNLQYSPAFYGLTKELKARRSEILEPLIKQEDIDIKTLVEKSGLTKTAISNWFMETRGITLVRFFRQRKDEKFKQELKLFYMNKTPLDEIAKYYGLTKKYISEKLVEFGIKDSHKDLNNRLKAGVPQMIHDGKTIDVIARKHNCSYNKAQIWIKENFSDDIVEYRHKKNILLNHENSPDLLVIKEKMKQYFAENKTIAEVSKLLGMHPSRVCYLKKVFKIVSQRELTRQKAMEKLKDLIPLGLNLREMAEIIGGISPMTVRRYTCALTGKNYKDIRIKK